MKKILFSLTFLLAALFTQAQISPIMVCNAAGNNCTPYYNIDSAISGASNGDYVYVPGGIYTIVNTIAKELHVFGAGSKADSSTATGATIINGNINLNNDASNSSFEGMYLSGDFSVTSITNLKISYCNFNALHGVISNSTIRGSIFRTGSPSENNFNNGLNNLISNCYIYTLLNFNSSTVDQCVDLRNCANFNYSTIKNSVLNRSPMDDNYAQVGSFNTTRNNVYVNACYYGPYCMNNIAYINNIQQTNAEIFVVGYVNLDNMHILPGSIAATASETGGEVGVFGGSFPFKEGLVPSNPHISFKQISSITDSLGNLPVHIKVRAENY